ncbi:NCS2 family nucleobase:cation symporter-2 [Paraburkholderia fungorum]|jgi:uric acid transporter|uniref:nucleobase:cation symporter-2 family protein n=1 Tax=Paraburkholderia fungorum TaxID=134537 RepID=UPI0016131242|nr:nucleobase:cation symporter-2 family protein [Paraburkholderia fungorum]MBB4519720.1 NCS2 family nucleobase:cation symporter-2 [Paraburkholderia fungorum]
MLHTESHEKLPLGELILLAIQHVLIMYAGAIATPLIIGAVLKLPKDQIAFLINADLLAGGLATLVQTIGFKGVGIRLPIMMGVTFTALGTMIAIGSNPDLGLLGIYGATISAGIFGILVAPLIGKLLRFFPPIVTGSEILMVGLSLMGVAAAWSGGGFGNPDFGNPVYLCIAGAVLVFVLVLVKYAHGFIANLSILLGLVFGFLIAIPLGQVSLAGLHEAGWIGWVMPLHFGLPKFDLWATASMCVVMLVTFVESAGMFLAIGEITGKQITEKELTRGFRADGLGNIIGGIFNTFPYTSFAQNVGLVAVTGVKSRWVCAVGGVILILLGLVPKLSVIVASIPPCVLGGAGVVMFGMVAANGIKTLTKVDFSKTHNLYIVAISVGVGMIPVVSDKLFAKLPSALGPILNSSILLTAVVAIFLNVILNGVSSEEEATRLTLETARDLEV